MRTSSVVTTTTGPLSWEQRLWVAVLHAGPTAMVGALTAAKLHGMRNWDRDHITVLVDDELSFDPIEGVEFFRTRRQLEDMRAPGDLPVCRIEPAILLFAGYERHRRTAHGAVTAVVQQRLTDPTRLRVWLEQMRPLRRAKEFRRLLGDIEGGAQSLAEVDFRRACRRLGLEPPKSQRKRRDRSGRLRYTDCEWRLRDGRTVVLEIDGAFHDDVLQASADRKRNRRLTSVDRVVIGCTAFEVRYDVWSVIEDLIALGVPRI